MSGWMIALCGFVHAYVTVDQYFKGDVAMSVVYFGYSVADFGFAWLFLK